MIQNFSQAEKALETSINSAGSAVKENAAYIDSIQGRIAQLKATFEDLSADVVNSELFKNAVSFLNTLLKTLDTLIEKIGTVPTLITVGALVFKNKSTIIDKLIDPSKEIKGLEKVLSKIFPKLQEKFNKNKLSLNVEAASVATGSQAASAVAEGSKVASGGTSIVTSLASLGKIAAIAIAIGVAMKAIQLIVETWFMRIQKAKEKVSELSEEYNNVKDELDNINSKLEENKKKIEEINENGLDFTGEQLAELQKQNEELELQKQYLEDIEEIKKKQLNNATQELLDLNNYSSLNKKTDIDSAVWEQLRNGQYEKALGTYGLFKYNEKDNDLLRILKDIGNVTLTPFNGPLGFLWNTVNRFRKADENITAQESAQEQINKLNDLLDTKKSMLSSSEGLDYTAYIEINDQIDEMNKSLTETMSYLTEQQKTLDENSKLYKQINDLVGQFSKTNENIKLNESGFIDLTLDTYFDEDNFNEDTFKKVQKKLQKKNIQFLMDGTINDRTTNYFKDILSQNGITIESDATLTGSTGIKAESYTGIINALEEINTLKEQGAWYDNAANNAVVERLSSLIKLTDEERDYVELVSKLNTYSFINGFLNNNDLGISNLSEIRAYLKTQKSCII